MAVLFSFLLAIDIESMLHELPIYSCVASLEFYFAALYDFRDSCLRHANVNDNNVQNLLYLNF